MDAMTDTSKDSKKEDFDWGKYARENGIELPDAPITFADMRGWGKEPPPPCGWAVRDHIPLGQVTLLSGEGGISKTQAALQLLCACVQGYDWFGVLPVLQGPAIYLGSEDDEDALHRRLHAIIEYPDHPFSSFEELARRGLHVASYTGRSMALAEFDGDGDLVHTALYERLWKEAQKIRPAIIVLDPLSDIFPGDENNRGQVTSFMGLLRNLAVWRCRDREFSPVAVRHQQRNRIERLDRVARQGSRPPVFAR
jgi:RecA-family ATPase